MFIVTECPTHGTCECPDIFSLARYVDAVNACITAPPHADEHRAEGSDCWVCCPQMVVDPRGSLDPIVNPH